MAIRASGSRQVRAMEVTLGGRLSKAAAKRPGAELARHVRERLARRKAHWNELKPLLAQARAPFVELLKKDKRSVASAGALRAAFTRREQKPHAKARPPELQIEPRMVGSGLTVKVPPYDNDGEWGSGEGHGSANGFTGKYTVQARGDGAAWAGVAANFLATENNPTQRFAALLDYGYSWFDWSTWGTAHNDASTHIWIWVSPRTTGFITAATSTRRGATVQALVRSTVAEAMVVGNRAGNLWKCCSLRFKTVCIRRGSGPTARATTKALSAARRNTNSCLCH